MKAGAYEYDEEEKLVANKKSNALPIWGNEKSMNLNPLILTNIQSSQYFKVNLYQLKTYHEVIDEIYYNVSHLEPWEKGSRKTSGQTGMCGGVRGVGAGGIVSTAFCILYKLYTLRLSRKQVLGLLNHGDSPYIRGLGFMYIRYTQPPADLWDWFESYLDDEEEIDIRAGGGQTTTVGTMVRQMLSKLDWYSTLFPRIPVPIQKDLEKKLGERMASKPASTTTATYMSQGKNDRYGARGDEHINKQEREFSRDGDRDPTKDRERERLSRDKSYSRERDRDYERKRDKSQDLSRERHRERNGDYERGRDKHRDRERERDYDRIKNRVKERRKSRSKSSDRKHRHRGTDRYVEDRGHRDFADLLEREKHRIKKEKRKDGSRERHHKSRSRSREARERHHRSRSRELDRRHRY